MSSPDFNGGSRALLSPVRPGFPPCCHYLRAPPPLSALRRSRGNAGPPLRPGAVCGCGPERIRIRCPGRDRAASKNSPPPPATAGTPGYGTGKSQVTASCNSRLKASRTPKSGTRKPRAATSCNPRLRHPELSGYSTGKSRAAASGNSRLRHPEPSGCSTRKSQITASGNPAYGSQSSQVAAPENLRLPRFL